MESNVYMWDGVIDCWNWNNTYNNTDVQNIIVIPNYESSNIISCETYVLTSKNNNVESIKLACTNNINIQNIINGLYIEQEAYFKYTNKGINVYVNCLKYKSKNRTIINNVETFIGFIPFKYVKQLRKLKKQIKKIYIKNIANKKYNKQKSIIIGIKYKIKTNIFV